MDGRCGDSKNSQTTPTTTSTTLIRQLLLLRDLMRMRLRVRPAINSPRCPPRRFVAGGPGGAHSTDKGIPIFAASTALLWFMGPHSDTNAFGCHCYAT